MQKLCNRECYVFWQGILSRTYNRLFKSRYNRSRTLFSLLVTASFMLFNLSDAWAQSPKNGETAEGQMEIKPLVVGQKVPDEFWTREHLFYVDGDTVRKTLEEFKGKVIIMDFWATWCGACLQNFRKLEVLEKEFSENLVVILVNPAKYRDDYQKLDRIYNERFPALGGGGFPSLIYDKYIIELFPHLGIPHYVWINSRGRFTAFTDTGGLNNESVQYQIMNPY